MEVNKPVSKKASESAKATSMITIKSSPLLISPQKMKVVAQLIRYQNLNHLLKFLPFLPHKGGRLILELLQKEVKY